MIRRSVIAFLTGQSDPASNALSGDQGEFLRSLDSLPDEKFDRNFPYRPVAAPFRETPIIRASLNNSRQYLLSRRPAFATIYRDEIVQTFAPYGRVIFLAGSCGLELFQNLELPGDFLAKSHLFAYGPVSRNQPHSATLWTVQGRRDGISRWWHPSPDHLIDCHHLNYLGSPEFRELFLRFHQTVSQRTHAEA